MNDGLSITRQTLIDFGFTPESGHDESIFWLLSSKNSSVRIHAAVFDGASKPAFSVKDAKFGPIQLQHLKSVDQLRTIIEVLL